MFEDTPLWVLILAGVGILLVLVLIILLIIWCYRRKKSQSLSYELIHGHEKGRVEEKTVQVSAYTPPEYKPYTGDLYKKYSPTLGP
ncbi:unnamed protein product [Blepharisma stoltei]|uniref:Uncharacterized protein n=1 Tax=Blepharisma stoltei TaxID=1481888 RepID=A0AAU9JUJ6_9CILI|nr:unnamed protein product [Blepharisma stoltei]